MTKMLNDCWVWDRCLSKNGYGQIRIDRKLHYTHRLAYEAIIGPIPEGLELDHLCDNRSCYNPFHLEPVTHAENRRRSALRRGSCKHGHPWVDGSFYVSASGKRRCKTCTLEGNRRGRLGREVAA